MHHKPLMMHDWSLQLKGYKPEPTSPLKLIQEFSIRSPFGLPVHVVRILSLRGHTN